MFKGLRNFSKDREIEQKNAKKIQTMPMETLERELYGVEDYSVEFKECIEKKLSRVNWHRTTIVKMFRFVVFKTSGVLTLPIGLQQVLTQPNPENTLQD